MQAHVWSNLVALAIAGGLGTVIVRTVRSPFWGPRLTMLYRRPLALAMLVVVGLFCLTAFLDAVAWKDPVDTSGTLTLEAQLHRSVLDRLFSAAVGVPEYAYREKSYSAPLAKTDFTDKQIKLKYRHLLGTTQSGYDTFYQLLKGCRPSITIGILPLLVAIPLAMLFGITAGYFGGRVDDIIVYVYSTLSSIPGLLLLIALIAALGQGVLQVGIGLGVTGWVGLCRLVRGETFKLREMEYVTAARAFGVPTWKILLYHVAPNLTHILIITSVLAFSGLVLTESILAYLGVGLTHSWGAMIDNARNELARDPVIWWNITCAFGALFTLVLSVNIVGDALRDILDPRLRE